MTEAIKLSLVAETAFIINNLLSILRTYEYAFEIVFVFFFSSETFKMQPLVFLPVLVSLASASSESNSS